MGNRSHTGFQDGYTMEPTVERVFFRILTTTSGTIDTTAPTTAATVGSATRSKCGITVAKTGGQTGRYTLTSDGYFVQLLGGTVMVEGTASAAMTAAKATHGFFRSVNPAAGTLLLQMYRTDTLADAEVEDAATIRVVLEIGLSRMRDKY